jgi:hypothetical protein
MKASQIHPRPMASAAQDTFRTAVSLHSHTLHSRESLSFVQSAASTIPAAAFALRRLARVHRKMYEAELDMSRGWWTPPLGPREAWLVEKRQIEDELDLQAMVSLSDHDNIDAPLQLRVLTETRDVPVSVEWTVPYHETFFHLGIHNLPPARAVEFMAQIRELTQRECTSGITALLHDLQSIDGVLIVFNHPLWNESGAGLAIHRNLAAQFFDSHRDCLHALELNGLRPRRENRLVAKWAAEVNVPLVSGGDRHGREPNACLNLTNAADFFEFAAEIRDGQSRIALMPHYDEPHALRVINNVYDILRYDEQHSLGWRRWSDRVFYQCPDGVVCSFTELWGVRTPSLIQYLVELLGLVGSSPSSK